MAHSLPDQAAVEYRERIKQTLPDVTIAGTEVERIVKARIGQDVFRTALMDYWG